MSGVSRKPPSVTTPAQPRAFSLPIRRSPQQQPRCFAPGVHHQYEALRTFLECALMDGCPDRPHRR